MLVTIFEAIIPRLFNLPYLLRIHSKPRKSGLQNPRSLMPASRRVRGGDGFHCSWSLFLSSTSHIDKMLYAHVLNFQCFADSLQFWHAGFPSQDICEIPGDQTSKTGQFSSTDFCLHKSLDEVKNSIADTGRRRIEQHQTAKAADTTHFGTHGPRTEAKRPHSLSDGFLMLSNWTPICIWPSFRKSNIVRGCQEIRPLHHCETISILHNILAFANWA
ncbi:hypothetical protein HDK64DRAFT_39842 [Phyllosticta capitalensis]